MKARKITLAILSAALAVPTALATTAPALASGGESPCQDPDLSSACADLGSTHTGTFTGTYTPKASARNDATACEDGNSNLPSVCAFWFTTGNPGTLCSDAGKAWSPGWDYRPEASQANDIGGSELDAIGGGALDFTGIYFGSASDPVITVHVHVQIAGLCGNEGTAQGVVDNVTAKGGFGTIDLSHTYKFSGYIDINAT